MQYVCNLRDAEGIPAPGKIRQYCEVEELPLGLQGQVDMGQQTMQDAYGKNVKVYIFAMVLSASRYKYTCFQLEPFTAQTFYATLAFPQTRHLMETRFCTWRERGIAAR